MLSARKRCIADPSIELGTTMPAPVSKDTADALTEYALAVARSVGLDLGVFHIEMIHGHDGPVLVEVNPRIMGGNMPTAFKLCTGVDAYELLIDIHLHGRLPEACRKVAPVRAATTRMIGPSAAAKVSATLAPDWDAAFKPHLSAWKFDIAPGAQVRPMESSFYPSYFQVSRPSPAESSLFAEWVISLTEHATGIDLRRSSEDYLLL
jgi:biotin carboxylase